ncbi:MAG: hypothetical protein ACYCV7_12480 [Acidimicrobiales bacterium]
MSTYDYWWTALGLGLAVTVVAVGLLQLFLDQVRRIERDCDAVWATAKRVARNTATTWMLAKTSERLDRLTEESLRHDDFLRGGAEPVTTSGGERS